MTTCGLRRKHSETTLLEKLKRFREQCRKEPALVARGEAWNLQAFDEALKRIRFDEIFSLIRGNPRITNQKELASLRKFGLQMIGEFNKGSEHNSLVALFSAMMVWQQLDNHFQGF